MRKLTTWVVVSAALAASSAWAADDVNAPTTNNYYGDTPTNTTTAAREDMEGGTLRDEFVAFKPSAGVLAFVAPNGETQARGALALLADINLSRVLPESLRVGYFGLTTGAIYSHIGSETSNFFGSNPSVTTTDPGSNVVMIPANIELGWQPAKQARVGIHGGGNVIYRSIASSMYMGDSSSVDGDVWRIFPNVGLDFDLGLAKNVSASFRPDYTFTPGQDVFTATLGLGISLG